MKDWLIDRLPESVVESLRIWRAEVRDARDWKAYRRRPVVPPPHAVKARTVIDYGRRHRLETLIETGTFEGEMARKCRRRFRQIYTIELGRELAQRAEHRLERYGNVRVIQGDSARRLPELLARVREPALFWLDGHYSEGETARGSKDTPLVEELDAIRRHGIREHVILIDDARLFGHGDYPDLGVIRSLVRDIHPYGEMTIADDILRCVPSTA